jgi:hypothetical protein
MKSTMSHMAMEALRPMMHAAMAGGLATLLIVASALFVPALAAAHDCDGGAVAREAQCARPAAKAKRGVDARRPRTSARDAERARGRRAHRLPATHTLDGRF